MRFVQFAKEKFTLHTKMRLKVLFFSNAKLSGAILTGADLTDANLRGANLRTSILKNATLDGAKFCKTQMLWGEVNDNCED